jgi:hypothetical protein
MAGIVEVLVGFHELSALAATEDGVWFIPCSWLNIVEGSFST